MEKKNKRALILVNTGTPDNPSVPAVRKYLFQFLNDKRVIDIPWLWRTLLVNLIIVPFRAPKSSKLYKKLWTKEGSPLLTNMNNLVAKLQEKLYDSYDVYGTMRYGNPSLKKTLQDIEKLNYKDVTILPLFPQYATSTTESIADVINNSFIKSASAPPLHFIRQFYNHDLFIKAFAANIKKHNISEYDHIIFSYHGLPLRQINNMHPKIKAETCLCTEALPQHGEYCYKATCYHTSRLLAKELNINEKQYTVSFQSRLSKNWLEPFTDETLRDLASKNIKKVLIVAPAFVADCLETTIELGVEYKELFMKMGGEKLTLVESLNDQDNWVSAIMHIIKN